MTPGTDIEQRNPARELVAWVRSDDARSEIAVALPENVSADRFTRLTATALLKNPDLAKLDRPSLFIAILTAAQMGLVPDGRQAAIVPHGNKATLIVMIEGVRYTLAGFGWSLRTACVYANDRFEDHSAEGYVVHRPVPLGADRGEMIGAFAMAVHRDGRREALAMSKAEIDEVRDKTSKNNPSWKNWYTRMAEKTPAHRLAKKLPLDPQDRERLARVIDAAELAPGESADLLYGANGSPDAADRDTGGSARTRTLPSADGTGGSQQAEDAPNPSAASSAPGDDDVGDIQFGADDPEDDGDADLAAAQAAAGYVVTSTKKDNWVTGKTLAQINADEIADTFFTWALVLTDAKGGNRDAELQKQAAAYTKVRRPGLYAELVESGDS